MKNLIFLSVAALLFASCKKEMTELPEPTETGLNIFGAKVDGKIWGPSKGIAFNSKTVEARFSADTSVFINAHNFASAPSETEMEIYLQNVRGPGTYHLNQSTSYFPHHSANYARFEKRRLDPQKQWITNEKVGGWVKVTRFDIENKIISGLFEFRAQSLDTTIAPIVVSEGRFDVQIQ